MEEVTEESADGKSELKEIEMQRVNPWFILEPLEILN